MYQTFIKPAFTDVKNFILDTLFPIHCLSCGRDGDFICAVCKPQLKKLEHQQCINCQKPSPFGLTHPGCLTPHSADALISVYNYHDEKVAKILIHGKYFFLKDVYTNLASSIVQKLTQYPNILISTNISLCPIPLHSSRQRWRGFNQAEVLCQALSRELNLPIADVLTRKKITKTQKDLKKEERLKNIDGAFTINTSLPSPILGEGPGERLRFADVILGQTFLLVDDVTTTGATLREAAKILKRNGAEKVICLSLARD